MSLPLKDFRLGITESIGIWLDAEATAFGADKADEARARCLDDALTAAAVQP